LDTAVTHLPAAVVAPEWVGRFLNGQAMPNARVEVPANAGAAPAGEAPGAQSANAEPEYRAIDAEGRLLAIATLSSQGMLCPKKVLARK
jgi:hypothetical protein